MHIEYFLIIVQLINAIPEAPQSIWADVTIVLPLKFIVPASLVSLKSPFASFGRFGNSLNKNSLNENSLKNCDPPFLSFKKKIHFSYYKRELI